MKGDFAMSKSTSGNRSSGQSLPVRSGKPDVPAVSCKVERASGHDRGEKGHSQRAAELQRHFGKK
jgi:hypothetical protein